MALLLDTHTFLWFINDDPRPSPAASSRIRTPGERVVVSVVSAWEIVIKLGTGKLTLDRPVVDLWSDALADNGFEPLAVNAEHVFALEPLPPHHRDPFDRLLIAQAVAEELQIVSADIEFDAYPIERIW